MPRVEEDEVRPRAARRLSAPSRLRYEAGGDRGRFRKPWNPGPEGARGTRVHRVVRPAADLDEVGGDNADRSRGVRAHPEERLEDVVEGQLLAGRNPELRRDDRRARRRTEREDGGSRVGRRRVQEAEIGLEEGAVLPAARAEAGTIRSARSTDGRRRINETRRRASPPAAPGTSSRAGFGSPSRPMELEVPDRAASAFIATLGCRNRRRSVSSAPHGRKPATFSRIR